MTIRKWSGIVAMLALAVFAGAPQADCNWEMLGAREVDHRVDHDEIAVTKSEGTFNAIQLRVQKAPVEFESVTVYFKNGTKQELDVREEVPAGGTTRTIDLQGDYEMRIIRRVEFDYRTAERGERAVVQLWGLS
jgi:hypothetical protein